MILKKRPYFFIFSLCFVFLTRCGQGFSKEDNGSADLADMVIYSYDRPLQLYALLESVDDYMEGLGAVSVIYRTSDERFERAYQEVHANFPFAQFLHQGKNPHGDFKPLLLKAAFKTPNDYIVFAVDDIIVKDFVDLSFCVRALRETDSYGLYLRLGNNITENYMGNSRSTPPPPAQCVRDGLYRLYRYQFKTGQGDWCYPNSNDMTVFKKSKVKSFFVNERYTSPTYEGLWSTKADKSGWGLFFETSKMINIPMNLVQTEYQNNRYMKGQDYSTEHLLELFQQGLKIDIRPLFQINNCGVHMDYCPEFVER